MPGGLLSDTARDLLAAEIVAAFQADPEVVDPDGILDLERAQVVARAAIDETQNAKVLAVTLPDGEGEPRTIAVQDLPIGVIDDISRKHDVGWIFVTDFPLQSQRLGVAADLVRAAAAQLKVPVPKNMTPRFLVDAFDTIPDDIKDLEGSGDGPLPRPDGNAA